MRREGNPAGVPQQITQEKHGGRPAVKPPPCSRFFRPYYPVKRIVPEMMRFPDCERVGYP